jgi:hypothetical protein
MVGLVIVSTTLLAFQGADSPQSKREQKPTTGVATAVNDGEAIAKYNALKEKAQSTPAAQWRLGAWCEEHGLSDLAYVHFAEVARLDPKRDAAWKKLGFKKVGGRWTTDEQIAQEHDQKKADKEWAPRLKKLHKDIHGTNGAKKREMALISVADISDARAILPVYREFGGGGQIDQVILVQFLGQVDKPLSSKILAMLAVYGKTPDVRRRATETLRGRSAEDFLDLLVGLMIDPYKYEVKPVAGPGSPGVLFVEGEKFNISRFYAPPAAPNITRQPGDIVSYDPSGMPLINRPVGITRSTRGVPGSKTLVKETDVEQFEVISPYQLMAEAQRGAVMAEAQLEGDVAMIRSINDDRKRFNDLVMAVAKDATGKNHGRTPKEWRDALAMRNQSRPPSKTPMKPTFDEMATLVYQPVFAPIGFKNSTFTRVYVDS